MLMCVRTSSEDDEGEERPACLEEFGGSALLLICSRRTGEELREHLEERVLVVIEMLHKRSFTSWLQNDLYNRRQNEDDHNGYLRPSTRTHTSMDLSGQ